MHSDFQRGLRVSAWCATAVVGVVGLARSQPVIVERILATVNRVPVMLSEVHLVQQLRGLGRLDALDATVDQYLMYEEARRLVQSRVTVEEQEAAYKSLLRRFPAAHELPEADLRRLARREAAVVRYIEFRFRPQVRVTEQTLRDEYKTLTRGEPAPPSFEELAAELHRRLVDSQLDERVEAWLRDLRLTARVRRNTLDGPAAPPRKPVPLDPPAPVIPDGARSPE